MSFDRVQHASDGKKYGAPDDHEEGVQQVDHYLKVRHYQTKTPFIVFFNDEFVKEQKLEKSKTQTIPFKLCGLPYCNKKHYFWPYDLAAWEDGHIIDESNPDLVSEIDGEKHTKIAAKIKAGITKAYIEKEYPNTKFVRIVKEDCAYPNYLHKRLGI